MKEFDLNNNSNHTGESVNQAPAPATTENPTPAPDSTTPAPDSTTPAASEVPAAPTSIPAAEDILSETGLPAGYLAEGYCKIAGKTRYIDPDLIGARAQEIAEVLAEGGLKPSGFNPILRELKKANKKNLPVEVKKGALAGAVVKAKLLAQKKRAPRLLVALLEQNLEAVQDTTDYGSAYQHLEAVGVYLTEYQK